MDTKSTSFGLDLNLYAVGLCHLVVSSILVIMYYQYEPVSIFWSSKDKNLKKKKIFEPYNEGKYELNPWH